MNYVKQLSLVIYWADNKSLLSYRERKTIELSSTQVVSVTPMEIVLRTENGRSVVVRGITDHVTTLVS